MQNKYIKNVDSNANSKYQSIYGHCTTTITSVSVLLLLITIELLLILKYNNGHFCYVIDDPYIHMSIAKNLATYDIFGVTKYGFSSSSSSIIYPLIIAAIYSLFGVNEITPLILNIIFASILIYIICNFLKQNGLKTINIILVAISIILFTPLPAIVFDGMEHTLQMLGIILFTYFSAKAISSNNINLIDYVIVLLLGILVIATRYDSILLLSIICLLFALHKNIKFAVVLFILGISPIIIYGIISTANGWFFLPNSIFLKMNHYNYLSLNGLLQFTYNFVSNLFLHMPDVFGLQLISILLLFKTYHEKKHFEWSISNILLITFILVAILHTGFGKTGYFFRYTAYLVCFGLFAIGLSLNQVMSIQKLKNMSFTKKAAIVCLLFVVVSPLAYKCVISTIQIPQASNNIYELQYQIGLFAGQFYNNDSVCVNDIGAIDYLADIHLLDVWGLGSVDVAKIEQNGDSLTADQLKELSVNHKVNIAILYSNLFKIPKSWIKVGQWTIKNNIIDCTDTFCFYATSPIEANKLRTNLKAFSKNLPSDIKQQIY